MARRLSVPRRRAIGPSLWTGLAARLGLSSAILFVVGFPVAMFLAWRFDIGPHGIRRTTATSGDGRVTIVAAVLLLVGATAGLFYLIYPSVVEQSGGPGDGPYRACPATAIIRSIDGWFIPFGQGS